MSVAERCQTKRSIVPRVFVIADSDQRLLEKLDDSREDLLSGQFRTAKIASGTSANRRQRLGKADEPVVLGLVAYDAPLRMIAILLSAAGVSTYGLKVSSWIGGNPHVLPRGRYDQRTDARQLAWIADLAPVTIDVLKGRAVPDTFDPRPSVGRIVQPRGESGFAWVNPCRSAPLPAQQCGSLSVPP